MTSKYNSRFRPKLRWPLEVDYQTVDGKRFVVLQCALGIVEEPLGLVEAVAPLLGQLNGVHTIAQIAEHFSDQGVTSELVSELVELLDKGYFLEGDRFDRLSSKVRNSYRKKDVRPSALAGRSFPPSEEALRSEVVNYLQAGKILSSQHKGKLFGLATPHIDYGRGGKCYGKAYNALREEQHGLYVLIGTSHKYSELLFHLSDKHFDSPMGRLRCDHAFVSTLASRYGQQRSFADEILHKYEHSLELQVPFMNALCPQATIAPILVGSFHQMITQDKLPEEFPEYDEFAAALAEAIAERRSSGGKVSFLAGVDMAHVGQSFGDIEALTPDFMEHIAERDAIYLQALQEQNKEMLFTHIVEDGDARRICGFPTMYTVLDVCDRLGINYTAELIDYSQAVDYNTDCAVTFAGMSFYLE